MDIFDIIWFVALVFFTKGFIEKWKTTQRIVFRRLFHQAGDDDQKQFLVKLMAATKGIELE